MVPDKSRPARNEDPHPRLLSLTRRDRCAHRGASRGGWIGRPTNSSVVESNLLAGPRAAGHVGDGAAWPTRARRHQPGTAYGPLAVPAASDPGLASLRDGSSGVVRNAPRRCQRFSPKKAMLIVRNKAIAPPKATLITNPGPSRTVGAVAGSTTVRATSFATFASLGFGGAYAWRSEAIAFARVARLSGIPVGDTDLEQVRTRGNVGRTRLRESAWAFVFAFVELITRSRTGVVVASSANVGISAWATSRSLVVTPPFAVSSGATSRVTWAVYVGGVIAATPTAMTSQSAFHPG